MYSLHFTPDEYAYCPVAMCVHILCTFIQKGNVTMDISARFDITTCDGGGQFGPNAAVNDHARVINGTRYDFTEIVYPDGAREFIVFRGHEGIKSFQG